MKQYPLIGKCLAVGIIFLFVGICDVPSIAQDTEKQLPASRGNWFYVGGSGPGNYTRIQDAIDDASDGDTVFVYHHSTPYYENLLVDKSIRLIGEDKNTTIIDGERIDNVVNITADGVTVEGFTIQNSNISDYNFGAGVYIHSNHNTISGNIITDNIYSGIELDYADNNTISNNIITNNLWSGIEILDSENNTISHNTISGNEVGIVIDYSFWNTIVGNKIENNYYGIDLLLCGNNIISLNAISDSKLYGIQATVISDNKICQNNFVGNRRDAALDFLIRTLWLYVFLTGQPLSRNVWDGNYWNRSRVIPYRIPGYIDIGAFFGFFGFIIIPFPSFTFDWHPAQEPYDIPGVI